MAICKACNISGNGMIDLYKHPNNVDQMFMCVSSISEINLNDALCIPCYDDLRIAYNFKQKCLQTALMNQQIAVATKFNSSDDVRSNTIKLSIVKLNNNKADEDTTQDDFIKFEEENYIISEDEISNHSYTGSNDDTYNNVSDSLEPTIPSSLPKSKEKLTFYCIFCKKSYLNFSSFHKHQLLVHKLNINKKVCAKVGWNENRRRGRKVKKELDVYSRLQDTQCEYCFVNFATEHLLREHEMEHRKEDKPYRCPEKDCLSTFKERFVVRQHHDIHSDYKKFKCNFCDLRFHQQCNARSHERHHTGVKPYLCTFCGKSFSTHSNLKTHMRFHTGERPYACPECPKRFTTHYAHKVHIRTHTQEKPYLCSECGKSFSSSGKLLVHKRIHTGLRPYKCSNCPSTFLDNTRLRRHLKIHSL